MEESQYQVIARRWRPKQFSELVGQEHIVRTLTNAIKQNRIAHAYLFVGPRGTGKTSAARLFAQALNCEDGPNISPPQDSPICQAIIKGACMDVIEIDGASNNSVDQIRDLREECQYAPTQCKFKIYIIDEVHMLSTAAFNALLKTLEEPPGHVKFIFATTEAHKVLPTIVSRCQRFEFRPIAPKIIQEKLAEIAKAENIAIEQPALASIARLANGGMRDAQSILDQLISFCGDKIVEQDVLNVYGLASEQELKELAQAIAASDNQMLVERIDALASEGRDLLRVLIDLEDIVHEALLDAIRNQGTSSLLEHELPQDALVRMLEVLKEGEQLVKTGLSEKVNFELTLLKAAQESKALSIDSIIQEITKIGKALPEEPEAKKKTKPSNNSLTPKADTHNEPIPAQSEAFFSPTDAEIADALSACEADIATMLHADEPDPEDLGALKNLPSKELTDNPSQGGNLSESLKTVPSDTRNMLDQLFRAEYKAITPITPEELIKL